jgi:hypothetical protein
MTRDSGLGPLSAKCRRWISSICSGEDVLHQQADTPLPIRVDAAAGDGELRHWDGLPVAKNTTSLVFLQCFADKTARSRAWLGSADSGPRPSGTGCASIYDAMF